MQCIKLDLNNRTMFEEFRHCTSIGEGFVQDFIECRQIIRNFLHRQMQELLQRNSITVEITQPLFSILSNETFRLAKCHSVFIVHLKITQLQRDIVIN